MTMARYLIFDGTAVNGTAPATSSGIEIKNASGDFAVSMKGATGADIKVEYEVAYLFAPDGLNAFAITYMELSSNYNFAQDILIPGAELDSDVKAVAYNRYFNLGGRFAQFQATGIFGGVRGTVQVGPGFPLPGFPAGVYNTRRFRGFSDPYFALRVGSQGHLP